MLTRKLAVRKKKKKMRQRKEDAARRGIWSARFGDGILEEDKERKRETGRQRDIIAHDECIA